MIVDHGVSEARTLANAPMPARIARLPRNRQGYPIPWFVATLDGGVRDFRIADNALQRHAVRFGCCWICGQRLGANLAFTIGPMCALNRISAEPPGHHDCATYSAQVCPFLATPQMVRRDGDELPIRDGIIPDAPGVGLARNPGVTLVWGTRSYSRIWPDPADRAKYLFQLGDPTRLEFYHRGRPATRDEIMASIDSGLPALQAACQLDADPAASLTDLDQRYRAALALLPA